jgi:hypothetical protein
MNIPQDVLARRDFKRNKLFNFALTVQGLFSKFVVLILLWSIWAYNFSDLQQIFIAKILLTIIFIGLGFIAPLIDLNQSHATNPLWTGHARFHLVWQVVAFIYSAFIGIPLLWLFSNITVLLIVIAYTYMWLISFLIAFLSMPLYDGKLNDINGVPEEIHNIFGKTIIVDRNIAGIVAMTIVTTFATFLILSS